MLVIFFYIYFIALIKITIQWKTKVNLSIDNLYVNLTHFQMLQRVFEKIYISKAKLAINAVIKYSKNIMGYQIFPQAVCNKIVVLCILQSSPCKKLQLYLLSTRISLKGYNSAATFELIENIYLLQTLTYSNLKPLKQTFKKQTT